MWNARGRAEFRFELKGGQKYCFINRRETRVGVLYVIKYSKISKVGARDQGLISPALAPPPPLNAALLEVDNIATCTSFMWNKVVKYTCKYMYI